MTIHALIDILIVTMIFLTHHVCFGFTPTTVSSSSFRYSPRWTTTTTTVRLMDAKVAFEQIYASQQHDVTHIQSTISSIMERKDLSWYEPTDQSSLIGYDAPGANGNVAWMSSLYVPSIISSFTIWNGPLTYIPHIVSRCCLIDDDIIELVLDYIPRSYGAYDQRDANGEYPGPEQLGRVAFEYSGNRLEYDTKFVTTSSVMPQISSYRSQFEQVIADNNIPPTSIYGPYYWNIRMKCTDHNIRFIQQIRSQVVQDWLQWNTAKQYDHRPGAPVNAQYVYDTKLQQNAYQITSRYYADRLLTKRDDDSIRQYATAECGPLDEAYVGGAS